MSMPWIEDGTDDDVALDAVMSSSSMLVSYNDLQRRRHRTYCIMVLIGMRNERRVSLICLYYLFPYSVFYCIS